MAIRKSPYKMNAQGLDEAFVLPKEEPKDTVSAVKVRKARRGEEEDPDAGLGFVGRKEHDAYMRELEAREKNRLSEEEITRRVRADFVRSRLEDHRAAERARAQRAEMERAEAARRAREAEEAARRARHEAVAARMAMAGGARETDDCRDEEPLYATWASFGDENFDAFGDGSWVGDNILLRESTLTGAGRSSDVRQSVSPEAEKERAQARTKAKPHGKKEKSARERAPYSAREKAGESHTARVNARRRVNRDSDTTVFAVADVPTAPTATHESLSEPLPSPEFQEESRPMSRAMEMTRALMSTRAALSARKSEEKPRARSRDAGRAQTRSHRSPRSQKSARGGRRSDEGGDPAPPR